MITLLALMITLKCDDDGDDKFLDDDCGVGAGVVVAITAISMHQSDTLLLLSTTLNGNITTN